MLKNFLKGCLAIAMVAALAVPAMAEMKVTGLIPVSVGLKTTQKGFGPPNEKAQSHLSTTIFPIINFDAVGDKSSAGFELDLYSDGDFGVPGGTGAGSFNSMYVQLNMSDALTIRLGKSSTCSTSCGFADGAGSAAIPLTYWGAEWAIGSGYGISATYKISDDMKTNFGYLTEMDKVAGVTGTTIHASLGGKAGAISYKVAYKSGTPNDPDGAADDDATKPTSTAMMLSGKFDISDAMSISLDYATKAKATAVGTTVTTSPTTGYAVQFVGKKLGPGDLTLTMANDATMSNPDTVATASSDAFTGVVYSYDLLGLGDPSLGTEINYFQTVSKAEKAKGGAEPKAYTNTFIGVSFIKFMF